MIIERLYILPSIRRCVRAAQKFDRAAEMVGRAANLVRELRRKDQTYRTQIGLQKVDPGIDWPDPPGGYQEPRTAGEPATSEEARMSKAEKWAKARKEWKDVEPDNPPTWRGGPHASVNGNGQLSISSSYCVIDAGKALEFARWIMDTFGEPEASGGATRCPCGSTHLPCPICGGVEGCSDTIPERHNAAARRSAAEDHLISRIVLAIKAHAQDIGVDPADPFEALSHIIGRSRAFATVDQENQSLRGRTEKELARVKRSMGRDLEVMRAEIHEVAEILRPYSTHGSTIASNLRNLVRQYEATRASLERVIKVRDELLDYLRGIRTSARAVMDEVTESLGRPAPTD